MKKCFVMQIHKLISLFMKMHYKHACSQMKHFKIENELPSCSAFLAMNKNIFSNKTFKGHVHD